ncbi:MAG: deoxyguanosinetriphosphate triphosphohydrolase [Pelagibacterales bacterium]|nr:deoxyguanosinetriphosphate triphosphohydrolase [Pelagibacterales bacterium]OUU61964.1 MAG: deoxyguanosinetriphosphate triphosphohydrolase [Alphaproteobacteria bacterium TMED62]|tara:strand:- start:15681 stop:16844 length:1164 start_codon:yes stop_codon:yes gene_type:complete
MLKSNFSTDFKVSKGRLYKEKEDNNRSIYQRDRDRVIHSSAFRRLEHKTQVFVYHEGDHYRSRLTHSLEVSQIARTIARMLALDEDLSEVIALAHDLGHTPFGHAGEEALNRAVLDYGGFDHNAQTLRIITLLEKKYFDFDGLNLTWETLEGIVKHNGPLQKDNLPFAIQDYIKGGMNLEINTWCGPEAQVAALSDDIAYFSHDFEDGIRANFFSMEEILNSFKILNDEKKNLENKIKYYSKKRMVNEIRRLIISKMIDDLILQAKDNIKKFKPQSSDDVRLLGKALIVFSDEMSVNMKEIRKFLTTKMYKHYEINRMTSKAKRIVADLYKIYSQESDCLPYEWKRNYDNAKNSFFKNRIIADYIAGMTDRFAINEHKKLYDFNKGW